MRRLQARRNNRPAVAEGQSVTVSRRTVLAGVASSAGVSVLLTYGEGVASAGRADAATNDANGVLWLSGSAPDTGRALLAVDSTGAVVGQVSIGTDTAIRTADGSQIVVISAADKSETTYTVYDAQSAARAGRFSGGAVWDDQPTVRAAKVPNSSQIVVLSEAMHGTPTGQSVPKPGPEGAPATVPVSTWTRTRELQVLDGRSRQVLFTSERGDIKVGTDDEIAVGVSGVVLTESSFEGTSISTAPLGPSGEIGSFSALGVLDWASPRSSSSSGAVSLLTRTGLAVIPKAAQLVGVDLDPVISRPRPARPYTPTVIAVDDSRVIYVDASRGSVVLVDTSSAKIVQYQTLTGIQILNKARSAGGWNAALDKMNSRLYVADPGGITGGIWVLDSTSLSVRDRLHSDLEFSTLWVSPSTGALFAQAVDGPLLVHSADGTLVNTVATSIQSAQPL